MKMRTGRVGRRYLLRYTGVFLILSMAVYLPFLISGKSMIWITDGESQYFPYLHYMGNAIRDFLAGLFGGDFIPRMYDFSIGMGDDINAVIRFHPLDFLSALVPGRYTELLYQFLILFRIYLAGLAFSAFCLYWNKKEQAVLVGSMIYITCGYVLKLGVAHPTFCSALIILPLLLLSAEQVMRRQSVLLFSAVTALGFLSNYYFMYMCTIGLAVYVLLRFFDLYRERRPSQFLLLVLRMGGAYLLGVGLTAVVLLPTVMRLGSSMRLDGENTENLLVYDNLRRYYLWFLDFISPYRQTGSNTNLNYTVLALPAVVLLFVRRWRQHLSLKLAFLMELALLLIPAGGYLMSGFSNVNNRWVFLLSFTVSLIFVAVAEDFSRLGRGQRLALVIVTLVFAGLSLGYHFLVKENVYGLAAMAELVVCAALILFLQSRRLSGGRWLLVLGLMTGVSAAVSGYMTYNETQGNTLGEYMEQGQGLAYYENSANTAFARIEDEDFYRVDTSLVSTGRENSSVILGYHGISMYNSIVNRNEVQYLLDQGSIGVNAVHRVFSMDGRAVSENLANVRYYLTAAGGEQNAPYGYTLREDLSDESLLLFENQHPLSFGYTYDTWMEETDYQALSPLERQQVMLETAVLEEPAGDLEQIHADQTSVGKIEVEQVSLPETGNSVKTGKKGYRVTEKGGSISFASQKRAGYERYIYLKGLEKNKEYSFVEVSTPEISKTVTIRRDGETYSLNRSDYMVCLGYDEESGEDQVTLTFLESGTYRLEEVEIWYVPMDRYADQVADLNQESLEQVTVEKNKVTGTVELSGEKFMVFSIPWGEGWSVYVDGEQRELCRANVMYMGLSLEAGRHEIELRYCTPGIKAGAVVSLVSLAVFLLLLALWIRKRRWERLLP